MHELFRAPSRLQFYVEDQENPENLFWVFSHFGYRLLGIKKEELVDNEWLPYSFIFIKGQELIEKKVRQEFGEVPHIEFISQHELIRRVDPY